MIPLPTPMLDLGELEDSPTIILPMAEISFHSFLGDGKIPLGKVGGSPPMGAGLRPFLGSPLHVPSGPLMGPLWGMDITPFREAVFPRTEVVVHGGLLPLVSGGNSDMLLIQRWDKAVFKPSFNRVSFHNCLPIGDSSLPQQTMFRMAWGGGLVNHA